MSLLHPKWSPDIYDALKELFKNQSFPCVYKDWCIKENWKFEEGKEKETVLQLILYGTRAQWENYANWWQGVGNIDIDDILADVYSFVLDWYTASKVHTDDSYDHLNPRQRSIYNFVTGRLEAQGTVSVQKNTQEEVKNRITR